MNQGVPQRNAISQCDSPRSNDSVSSNHSSPRPPTSTASVPLKHASGGRSSSRSRSVSSRSVSPTLEATITVSIEEIESLLGENERLLHGIEDHLNRRDDVAVCHDAVMRLCANVRILLRLTDTLAQPTALPFMPCLVRLPPELALVPQELARFLQDTNTPHF